MQSFVLQPEKTSERINLSISKGLKHWSMFYHKTWTPAVKVKVLGKYPLTSLQNTLFLIWVLVFFLALNLVLFSNNEFARLWLIICHLLNWMYLFQKSLQVLTKTSIVIVLRLLKPPVSLHFQDWRMLPPCILTWIEIGHKVNLAEVLHHKPKMFP